MSKAYNLLNFHGEADDDRTRDPLNAISHQYHRAALYIIISADTSSFFQVAEERRIPVSFDMLI